MARGQFTRTAEMRATSRAAWTPERRAAQSARAKAAHARRRKAQTRTLTLRLGRLTIAWRAR
jgi:hypothetical protein